MDCIACPYASSACSVFSDGARPSKIHSRLNLSAKLQVWCLQRCAGWMVGKSRYTVDFVLGSPAQVVPLVPERENGSGC